VANNGLENEPLAIFKYFTDWWAYLRGPKMFLANQNLSSAETFSRSSKILAGGTTAAIALATVNLKFSPYVGDEQAHELLTARATGIALVLGCVFYAAIAHVIALVLRGNGNWRQTYVTFAFTFGFLWPVSAFVLIVNVLFIKLVTGLSWTALPPFDVPIASALERTTGNIIAVAFSATIFLWLIGFLVYCYGCAIWAAHRISVMRISVALIVAMVAINVKPVVSVLYWISEKFEPLIGWTMERF